jgi:hypothetical protein
VHVNLGDAIAALTQAQERQTKALEDIAGSLRVIAGTLGGEEEAGTNLLSVLYAIADTLTSFRGPQDSHTVLGMLTAATEHLCEIAGKVGRVVPR